MAFKTEDIVRDEAKISLGFDKQEKDVKQGTGQITTFNQLGFNGIVDKPDGWYLPNDVSKPAIILETKSESEDLSKPKWTDELFKNLDIVSSKYSKHYHMTQQFHFWVFMQKMISGSRGHISPYVHCNTTHVS